MVVPGFALDPAAERRILGFAAFGLVLGPAGLAFGYGILLPRAVHFLTGYDATHFRLLLGASSYYSFVVTVLLGVVCIFESPLVMLALVALFEGSIWLAAWAERRAAKLSLAGAQA